MDFKLFILLRSSYEYNRRGMICTNDKKAYYDLLMLRSHGMIEVKTKISKFYEKNIKTSIQNLFFIQHIM